MSGYYYPDGWQFLHIQREGESVVKLFSLWLGGYLDSDNWRLNSGCTKIELNDDTILVHGYSGSVYHLSPGGEGYMNNYGYSAIQRLKNAGHGILVEEISVEKAALLIGEQNV